MSIYNLVGHFLRENNLAETLQTFEREYGKPLDLELRNDQESLAHIVQDRIQFNGVSSGLPETVDVNGLGTKDDDLLLKELQVVVGSLPHWTVPYPKNTLAELDVGGLVISSCVDPTGNVVMSTADLKLHIVDTTGNTHTHKSPIGGVVVKKVLAWDESIALCGMNGRIHICSTSSGIGGQLEVVQEFQAHTKLITDAQVYESKSGQRYIVTLGWDYLLKVFASTPDGFYKTAETTLSVQGTCISVTSFAGEDYVVLGKNEQTLLEVYRMENLELAYKISLNDAIFSTTGFSPRSIVSKDGLVVVATSHEPYMRLIVVTLSGSGERIRRDQIIRNLNTMAPQDKFSQPVVGWRSDYSGVWVAGEDGKVRAIDIKQQRIVAETGVHDGKIKSFSSGHRSGKEVVISCGVDRVVKIWS